MRTELGASVEWMGRGEESRSMGEELCRALSRERGGAHS